MEGLVAEKDEFVADDLRDIEAIGIGMINEQIELTLLDRLLLLSDELGLPDGVDQRLGRNRNEARTALEKMKQFLEARRRE